MQDPKHSRTPLQARLKGRGAQSVPSGRFESLKIEPLSYEVGEEASTTSGFEEGVKPHLHTRFYEDKTSSIIARNDSPDIPFEASVNPYRGCEHGCIYCFARPTHEYLGLSAGLDFESKILVKKDAPELLRKQLASRNWVPSVINISGVTDCYQPAERGFRLTRGCLEVLRDFRNPFTIITKNHLVTRDIDILSEMAALQACAVFVSVTSLDEELIEKMEPRTSRPSMRLRAIEALSRAGIPVGAMIAPIIPGLTDHEIPSLLKAVADAGAKFAGRSIVRLPYGVKDLFIEWLGAYFPDRKEKVIRKILEMRGGKLNVSEFGRRMNPEGETAENIANLFRLYAAKYGVDRFEFELSTKHFRKISDGDQFRLF